MNEDILYFYSKIGEYGEFSNFYRSDFFLDGKMWRTVEHYYQASKFPCDESMTERIRNAKSPKVARQLGRSPSSSFNESWDEIKLDVMAKALKAKFTSSDKLKKKLISTASKRLVEASPYDYYWGCGADGKGENMLGRLLMQLREDFLNEN